MKETLKQFHRDKANACELDIDLTVNASIITLFMGNNKEIVYTFHLSGPIKREVR